MASTAMLLRNIPSSSVHAHRGNKRQPRSSCQAATAPRSRTLVTPQAIFLGPRRIAACAPPRFYRSPLLGGLGGLALVNNMLASDWLRETTSTVHPMEIVTHEDRYELQADCPGMSQEDITVEVSPDQRVLTVAGARRAAAATSKRSQRRGSPAAPETAEAAEASPASDIAAPPDRTAAPPSITWESDVDLSETTAAAPEAPKAEGARSGSEPGASEDSEPESPAANVRYSYRFERSFMLPEDADVDGISAQLDKGVLTLNIPRRVKARPQPRRIVIN